MPNWVYNYLEVAGSEEDISNLKKQLNQPFSREHDQWNAETGQMEKNIQEYNNPVFAFWNIIKPTNLEAYFGEQPKHEPNTPITFDSDHWYDWNVRNWGTKWDVSVHDDDKYPETELYEDTGDSLCYKFNTAWSPPVPVIGELSTQYPNLTFTLSDCGQICNACHYLGEADLECVAECDIHKVFLDNEHVPDYRKAEIE